MFINNYIIDTGDLQQPFNQLVLKFFVKQLDLSGLLIDVALR